MPEKAKAKGNVETFIRLTHGFVRSERWRDLSSNGSRVLIEMWALYDGKNNGRIRFSVRDAQAALRCSTMTARRTFDELEAAGLIEAMERGGFRYRADGGRGVATLWRITLLPMAEKTC